VSFKLLFSYLARQLYHRLSVKWFFCLLVDFRLYHAGFQLPLHPCPERFWVSYGEAGSISPAEGAECALKHPRVIARANLTLVKVGPEFVIWVHVYFDYLSQ